MLHEQLALLCQQLADFLVSLTTTALQLLSLSRRQLAKPRFNNNTYRHDPDVQLSPRDKLATVCVTLLC